MVAKEAEVMTREIGEFLFVQRKYQLRERNEKLMFTVTRSVCISQSTQLSNTRPISTTIPILPQMSCISALKIF